MRLQEELNIVIQITKQQLELIQEIQKFSKKSLHLSRASTMAAASHLPDRSDPSVSAAKLLPTAYWATARQHSVSRHSDPISQLLDNLNREYVDLCDLRDSTSSLVERTIKLVNLRLEDHGKAIMVFTIVTVIFLPLSFLTSYFGMNFADIRDTTQEQSYFWVFATSITVGVVAVSIVLAFFGPSLHESFLNWKEDRQKQAHKVKRIPLRKNSTQTENGFTSFEVLDTGKHGAGPFY